MSNSNDEKYGGEDRQQMADDTVDVIGAIEPDNAEMYIDAGPLHVGFTDGVTGGLRVIQDGNFLAISQGVDFPDGDRATVGHDLTPDEAREFADLLVEAAENVEERHTDEEKGEAERASLLKRVVGGVFA